MLSVVDGGGVRPDPPSGLMKVTRDAWESFWGSPVATAVDVRSDLPALERLFALYDERHRSYREFRKCRMVEGSMGQPVVNPLAKLIKELDTEIRQLEDRFGLTPMARLRLGVTFGEAASSLERLNRGFDDDDDEDEPDPRLAAIEAPSSVAGQAGVQVD